MCMTGELVFALDCWGRLPAVPKQASSHPLLACYLIARRISQPPYFEMRSCARDMANEKPDRLSVGS